MKIDRTHVAVGKCLASALLLFFVVAGVFLAGGGQAFAQATPDFGPNVYIITPAISSSAIETTLTSLSNEAQFSSNRYAVLFMPGTYDVQAPVGYYESLAGLGQTPGAVTINGFLTPNFGVAVYGTSTWPGNNVTDNFWRSMSSFRRRESILRASAGRVERGRVIRCRSRAFSSLSQRLR